MGDTRRQPKSLARQAARYAPSAGIFGPTTGLDHRLFTAADGQFRLRGEVRAVILERLDRCIRTDSGLAGSDWQGWTRVYLMGGSASEWAGDRPNDTAQDLDVIVAIDLREAQRHNAFEALSAGEAASALNAAFWKHFNADNWHAPFGGIWNLTAFCNQRAWYVEDIRPYAAWDLMHDGWAVVPPHLPEHTIADFSPAVIAHARAVAAEARAILRMDEPLRTREATALWNHVHEHRCQAFSPEGTGWDDPGNVDEKYLAYHPHRLLQKIKDLALGPRTAAGHSLRPKDEVDYRQGSNAEHCGNCVMIRDDADGGHRCTLVAGKIDPQAVCDEWSPGKTAKTGVAAASSQEYWIGHRPPGPGHTSQGGAPRASVPYHEAAGRDPGDLVDVYRAAPGHADAINPGDWVTLHGDWARERAESEPGYQVLHARVPARHVYLDAAERDDDEAGYHGPGIRAQAAAEGYLRNPYHGTPEFGGRGEWSHTWFHGTRGEPDFGTRRKYSEEAQRAALPPEQRVMNSGWTQPNQHLGVHFSPLHEVGHKFAPSTWRGPTSIAHVRLRGSNPAHFETEEHLNIAMADWASRHYPHWHNEKLNSNAAWNYSDQEGTHRDFSRVPDDPGQRWRMSQQAQSLLTFHPHMPEILAGFKAHLREQGHHGITYGNGVEGPYDTDATRGGEASTKAIRKHENWPRGAPKSISAIADPEDIEVTHVEHIAGWRKEPEGEQRTWEDVSDSDEPDEMRDRVLGWHREHGGQLPRRLASAPHYATQDGVQEDLVRHLAAETPSRDDQFAATSMAPRFEVLFEPDYHGRHRVSAWPHGYQGDTTYGEPLGSMQWHPQTGQVTQLHVRQVRQGIGTALWGRANEEAAKGLAATPVHSPSRTPAADAWAHAVGGEIPPLSEEARSPEWAASLGDDAQFRPKTASREEQLAAMDPQTRAAALAQEHVRLFHPKLTTPIQVRNGQSSVVLSTWLAQAGHPGAPVAYIAEHPNPGVMSSNTGRGPDGEPVVVLHPDRKDYGTLAHEAAHLIADHETGRRLGEPHGPDGAHDDRWAGHYARLLDNLSSGAGDEFLAERDYERSAMHHEASAGPGIPQRPKRTPGSAMVYLDVPHGVVQQHEGQEAGHHIALAYLPRKIGDEAFGRVVDRAREAAARHAPMKATISGGMIFPPGTPPDRRRASVVPVHAPGIHELHAEFRDFDRAHYETYAPHVTRAQLGGHQADPEPHPEVSFPVTHLHVRRGDEVHSFPLTGPNRMEAAIEEYDWRSQPVHVNGRQFALGDVSGGRLYHGSPYEMAPGEIIRPGVKGPNFKASAPDAVSVTSHASRAHHWARDTGADPVHVYEVEPLGHVEPWRAAPADYGQSFQLWEARTPAARVVRRVPEHEFLKPGMIGYVPPKQAAVTGDRGANWVDDARKTISDMAAAKGHSLTWTADEIDERRPNRMYWWRASCDNCGEPAGKERKALMLPQDPAENADHWLGDNEHLPHWVTVKCSQGRPRKDPGARAYWTRELREKQDASEAEATAKREYWQQRRQAVAIPPYNEKFISEDEHGLHSVEYRHPGGGLLGYISWNPESGTVDNIEVDSEHRRKGIATRLWDRAREITPHLRHDQDDEMTDDGRAWAAAVDRRPGVRREAVSGYDGLTGRTAMIYLELPPGTVRPVPGGVDDHHITLVYLGKNVSDEKWAQACRRVREAASQCPPMDGVLKGIDIFPPSASSDGKVPAFVPAYVGGIGRLRRMLEDLSASEHKDYRPHVTLAYMEEGDSLPAPHPAVPLRFTHLCVKRGDDVRRYPFGQEIAATAAYRQPPTLESWEARRQRVDRYLAQQPRETMSIPAKWGPHTPNYVAHGLIQEHDGPVRDEHWEHLPDEYVSLRQPIHTHQGFVYPETVRHYLRLDADPDQEDYREYTPGGDEPKIVRHQGTHYLLDGHHRYVKDRLMGHESMSAKVFDTSNPEHKQSNCYECHAEEAGNDYDHDSDECDTCQKHGWYV